MNPPDAFTVFAKHIVTVIEHFGFRMSNTATAMIATTPDTAYLNRTTVDYFKLDLEAIFRSAYRKCPDKAAALLVDITAGLQPAATFKFAELLHDLDNMNYLARLVPYLMQSPQGHTALATCVFVCSTRTYESAFVGNALRSLAGKPVVLKGDRQAQQLIIGETLFGPAWSQLYQQQPFSGVEIVEYVLKMQPPLYGATASSCPTVGALPDLSM